MKLKHLANDFFEFIVLSLIFTYFIILVYGNIIKDKFVNKRAGE